MQNQNPPNQNPNPQPEQGFVAGFLKFLPAIQWFVMILIAVAVFFLAQRDSQTIAAQELRENTRKIISLESYVEKNKEERNRQFEQIRREMLTREVYDAYHKSDSERMARMEKMIEQILTR